MELEMPPQNLSYLIPQIFGMLKGQNNLGLDPRVALYPKPLCAKITRKKML